MRQYLRASGHTRLAETDGSAVKRTATGLVETIRPRANLSVVPTETSTGERRPSGGGRSGSYVRYQFEDFVLDSGRCELTRGSEQIAIGPQVFDLLVYVVRNRERVVSKDDLLHAVWRGRIVSESTLTSHINAARKAIGDRGTEQRLIRTVARKGIRFLSRVSSSRIHLWLPFDYRRLNSG